VPKHHTFCLIHFPTFSWLVLSLLTPWQFLLGLLSFSCRCPVHYYFW
jgi:hypothetical protein